MTVSPVPDLADVLAARQRIAPYLRPTPLYRYPALDAMTGLRCGSSTRTISRSVAYAADLFGVRAVICMPEQANPVKVESMRALGAEVVFHGRDFDEAREDCEQQAARHGYRYIHSGNEPALIAGVATYTLEILQARPDTEVIVVPVGGGSEAAPAEAPS